MQIYHAMYSILLRGFPGIAPQAKCGAGLSDQHVGQTGGIMRASVCTILGMVLLLVAGISPAWPEEQLVEGYTVVRGPSGPVVCLGRWVPSRDVALPGFCEGQLVDMIQLSAISNRVSADRLDQMLPFLAAIDQKLAVNNEQMRQLTEATVKVQASFEQQSKQISDLLQEVIARRFETLPEEIVENSLFREELARLREDILKEVEKYYTKRPGSPAK